MTDRYARQTNRNLLGGMGGAALVGHQQIPATTGDENNMHMINKNISLKTASITSSTSVNSITTTASMTITSSSSQSLATSIGISQASSQQQPAYRNALGDIGNKLKAQYLQKANNQLQPQPTNKIVPMNEDNKVVISSNNSCIMEEVVEQESMEDVEVIEQESIADIDEFDSDNTQLCAEYVKDIYKYLSQVEKQYRISPTFLDSKIVTTKMRAVLIDWLIQVHSKFHLLQETLYLCIQIIDAYLMVQDVPKMQLQLVGVTAMFVASKYEEMYVPAIDDFVYMTDNTYTKAEIRQMEISILKTLNFMFCKPLPLHFLRRFSKAGQADPKQHTLAKYFMELSLHDAEFSSMDPSYLAASSLCLSFKLLNGADWNRTLEYYSTYKQSNLLAGMQKIAKLVLKASDPDYKYRAVVNKYVASKLMRISLLPELSSSYMKELATGASK
jgi:G2/mitotic-specific cyclin-B2